MKFFLYDIAKTTQAVGNFLDFDNFEIKDIKTDSRLIEEGDLFVCLIGRHFDGHSFAKDAVKRGAVAVLGEKFLDIQDVPCLIVEDSLRALGEIARFVRERFKGKVIGITGSCGKTTVKELVASVLSAKFKVGKSYKNWNNDLGVPLSIFKFDGDEDFWVIELGISRKGDMDRLASIVRPDIAVLINVGLAHTEGLGDLDGVMEEKLKILDFLNPHGFVLYNKDIEKLEKRVFEKFKGEKFGFSTATDQKVRFFARYLKESEGIAEFVLDNIRFSIKMEYPAEYMIENMLVAASVGYLMGVDVADIKEGLTNVDLPEHRCDIKRTSKFFILDDCYNANPLSMKKSIRSAYNLSKAEGLPFMLLLGDMKELGKETEAEHKRLGEFVKNLEVDKVFYFGEYANYFLEGFKEKDKFRHINNKDEFCNELKNLGVDKAFFLVKGSRSCGLERFVEILMER